MLTKKQPKQFRSLSVWHYNREKNMALTTNDSANVNGASKRLSVSNFLYEIGQAGLQNIRVTFKAKMTDVTKSYRLPLIDRLTLLLIVDILLTFVLVWLAQQTASMVLTDLLHFSYLDGGVPFALLFPTLLFSWLALAFFSNLYDISSSDDNLATVMRIAVVGLLGTMIYIGLSFLFTMLPSVLFFVYAWSIVLLGILVWRFIYSALAVNFIRPQRIIVLGTGKRGQAIAKLFEQSAHLKYQMVGYIDETGSVEQLTARELPIIGALAELPSLVQHHNAHEVVVAINGNLTEEQFQWLAACQSQGVKVSWLPDLYEKLCYSVPVEYIDPAWALHAVQGQPIFNRLQLMGKRCVDLAIVLFGLPSFLLLIPLLMVAIRLDSEGPVFYRQVRTGRGGKPFWIWKFRTMVTDAEKDGVRWASKNDKRITRVGRFLRKTRLDELPQIFNIVRGEMSIVGPRPERPEFIEQLEKEIPFYRTRLMVKPGLTGWAQVRYDYGNTVEDALFKLHYDFYYIRYWSLWMDFYIILKTVAVVLKFKGM